MVSLLMGGSFVCFSGLVILWASNGVCLGRPTIEDSSQTSFPVTKIFWDSFEHLSERGIGLKRLTFSPFAGFLAGDLTDGLAETPPCPGYVFLGCA